MIQAWLQVAPTSTETVKARRPGDTVQLRVNLTGGFNSGHSPTEHSLGYFMSKVPLRIFGVDSKYSNGTDGPEYTQAELLYTNKISEYPSIYLFILFIVINQATIYISASIIIII